MDKNCNSPIEHHSPIKALPLGTPASSKIWKNSHAALVVVVAGFHSITLPIMAAPVARLPPIAVKLNGLIAATKPYKTQSVPSQCAYNGLP